MSHLCQLRIQWGGRMFLTWGAILLEGHGLLGSVRRVMGLGSVVVIMVPKGKGV